MWGAVIRFFILGGAASIGSTLERWFGGGDDENPTGKYIGWIVLGGLLYVVYKVLHKQKIL